MILVPYWERQLKQQIKLKSTLVFITAFLSICYMYNNPAVAGKAHSLYSDGEQLHQWVLMSLLTPAAGMLLLLKLLRLPDWLNLDTTCQWVKMFGKPKQQSGSHRFTFKYKNTQQHD